MDAGAPSFKGFHAVQTHRLAHWPLARRAGGISRSISRAAHRPIFQTDIHPASHTARGTLATNATGPGGGETAVVEDKVLECSHGVTLGGTAKAGGDRHPSIREGVLIGAGAQRCLGNTKSDMPARCCRFVVLKSVPNNKTVAGVPAKHRWARRAVMSLALRMDHFSQRPGLIVTGVGTEVRPVPFTGSNSSCQKARHTPPNTKRTGEAT